MPQLYRTKPQDVEAVQYDGNKSSILEFAGEKVTWDPQGNAYLLGGRDQGAQKWSWLPLGSWVVRKPGDTTDYWQVEPREFAARYKEVKEGAKGGKKAAKKAAPRAAQSQSTGDTVRGDARGSEGDL